MNADDPLIRVTTYPDYSNRWLEKSAGQTNFETACFTIAVKPFYHAPPANQGLCAAACCTKPCLLETSAIYCRWAKLDDAGNDNKNEEAVEYTVEA